ncbi:unnamed protein product [Lampetra planeri]
MVCLTPRQGHLCRTGAEVDFIHRTSCSFEDYSTQGGEETQDRVQNLLLPLLAVNYQLLLNPQLLHTLAAAVKLCCRCAGCCCCSFCMGRLRLNPEALVTESQTAWAVRPPSLTTAATTATFTAAVGQVPRGVPLDTPPRPRRLQEGDLSGRRP